MHLARAIFLSRFGEKNILAAKLEMSAPARHEEPISKKHDRKSFDCGDSGMNDFFERYARQSHDSGAAMARPTDTLPETNHSAGGEVQPHDAR
jgi:hypothetical protein